MHHPGTSSQIDEEEIFQHAAGLVPAERPAYLSAACAGNDAVRARIERFLRLHEDREFMGIPAERTVSSSMESELPHLKPEEVGERIANYKLLEQIGEGGFGVVWVAEQEKPMRRRVALKIIKLGMDTKEVIARFEQERQALAMMDHPNIAKVLDAGATPLGRPFFVMELVRGIKITEYCDQANLPTAERLRLFIAACHAVQHAHQKGIIHRDLKPSNILVTLHDGVPVPKVIDFGVAKATQQQRLTDLTVYTQFEQMIGTPLYMSPEQAEMSGLDIDTRSDVYSLGVLLYELLAGRTPFDPEELMKRGVDEIRRAVREQEPQKPSTFVSTMAVDLRTNLAQHRQTDGAKLIGQIRGDLDWIVMKALEKDRTRRYETANGLAQDIQRHLLSEPVQARPASQLYRFRRFAKRNKAAFAAGAGIAAALIMGSVVSIWQAVRANAALSDLRASAPAFAAMSRGLVAKEQFDEAIEKLNSAIKLRSDSAGYVLAKADLLESQLRFAEAAPLYREVLRLNPGEERAKTNAVLCENLSKKVAAQAKLSRNSLVTLFSRMTKEQRSAAEMMKVGKLLGEENKLLLGYWLARLRDLPIAPERALEERLTADKHGELALDLSNTEITDLKPLAGMPLGSLDLRRCDKVVDASPLLGMPLKTLALASTEVVDLEPLRTMKSLTELQLSRTKVQNLEPLRDLPLQVLDLTGSRVSDLAPLRGMPLHTLLLASTPVIDLRPLVGMKLRILDVASTRVADVAPLAGTPLEELDCSDIPAHDFSAIAGLKLQYLSLNGSGIRDLSVLRGMPLKRLNLNATKEARGFEVVAELKSLQELTLPSLYELTESEFAAIARLRESPSIEKLKVGSRPDFPPREVFWKEFASDARGRQVNADARALCREGKYAVAAHLFRDLLREEPSIATHNAYTWMTYGVVLLASGDISGYQAICKEMMARFRRRGAGDEVAVRLCLLSPESGVPIQELRRLMPHLALINPNSIYYCRYVVSNGLLEYRAGKTAEAMELLASLEADGFPTALASGAAVLAMAHYQQGNLVAAKAQVDYARTIIGPGGSGDWAGLLIAQILLQEAEKLIESAPGQTGEK